MSAWEQRSLPTVGVFSRGRPHAARDGDAPPAPPRPLLPLHHPSAPGPAPPLAVPRRDRVEQLQPVGALVVAPKVFPRGAGLWRAPRDEGLACLRSELRGAAGKLGLREELWSFLRWAGFHLGKAEPCVPPSALVLLTGESWGGGTAEQGRASAAGPWDRCGCHPFGIQSVRLCRRDGLGEPPARRWVPLPRVPSQGEVCSEMGAPVSPEQPPEQSWRWGHCLSSRLTHPVSEEQQNPTVQLRSGFGAFFPRFGASFAILGLV